MVRPGRHGPGGAPRSERRHDKARCLGLDDRCSGRGPWPQASVRRACQDCLSYRDNPHVAACANQYGQAVRGRSAASAQPGSRRPRRNRFAHCPSPELKSVPVVVAVKATAAPAPEPETPTFTVDRQVLTNTVIIGAIAGSLLMLVALGFWRWGSTLLKDCPWCASKISRSAHTCPSCFRADLNVAQAEWCGRRAIIFRSRGDRGRRERASRRRRLPADSHACSDALSHRAARRSRAPLRGAMHGRRSRARAVSGSRCPAWIPGSYLVREFARHFVAVRAESNGCARCRSARRRRMSGAPRLAAGR